MEFDENQISDDDEEDEMDIPYESSANSLPLATTKSTVTRYIECLKNHATAVGGHAVDGCGEFLPLSEDGTIALLKCAACNCHRNFHRKETEGERPSMQSQHHNRQIRHHHYRTPPPSGYLQNHHHQHHDSGANANTTPVSLHHRTLALPAVAAGHNRDEQDVMSNPGSSGGGGGNSGGGGSESLRKRYRTKFTGEQKDKMLGSAERLEWRIQKRDEASVEQFCEETSIKRDVLNVWMRNNKHT